MSVPVAGDLTQMRAAALLLMPDRADITDPGTVTVTDSGGTTITGPSTTAGVACRLARTGTQSTRNEFGEQLTSEADYLLSLPYNTMIREGWSVAVGGVSYRVLSVAKSGRWGAAVRALLEESVPIGG